MSRIEWLLVILPFVATWSLDRSTKLWALQIKEPIDWGILQFYLHFNPGAMLGLFSDLPPFLRVVSLSTAGAFILAIYFFLQYLLPFKSLVLRGGMSILVAGILGNVTDRILYGHVIDFVYLKLWKWNTPIFNVADSLQWIGYFLIIFSIIKDGHIYWPTKNTRRRYWINPQFQIRYCVSLLIVGFTAATILSVFSYTYLRITLIEIVGQNSFVLKRFLEPFFETFVLIVGGISLGLFVVGKIISHRIAGPIYAFERYLEQVLDPNIKNIHRFRLRHHDEFKELEKIAEKLRLALKPVPNSESNPGQNDDVSAHSQPIPADNLHPKESTPTPKAS